MNVLFCDLETTGLNEHQDLILEVGLEVVTPKWEVVETYSRVVCPRVAPRMDEVVVEMHRASGLLAELEDGVPIARAHGEALAFVQRHFPDERAFVIGNTIEFDRRFLRAWMPEVDARLHKRMLDVTALLEMRRVFSGWSLPKPETPHRVRGDMQSSRELLRLLLA